MVLGAGRRCGRFRLRIKQRRLLSPGLPGDYIIPQERNVSRSIHVSVLVVLCLVATSTLGATRYVSDELRISLRAGAGNQYRILRVLDTGTRLETLQTEGEWTQVRASDVTGWVRSQYLKAEPVAADQLQQARNELGTARERIDTLTSRLNETRQELEATRNRVQELTAANQTLQEQLDSAQEGLEMAEENERLSAQATELQERIDQLEGQVTRLNDRSQREWFLIGAGVLLGGILLGIIVTRIPWRRRNRMFE